MTSKEALYILGGNCEYYIQDLQENLCSGDSEKEIKEAQKEIDEAFDMLEKDLEILEIIKKWSFLDTFYREDTDTTYDRFLCNIHTKGMKEDFKKVKEWLENDK